MRLDIDRRESIRPADSFEDSVREHCDCLLRSPQLDASARSRAFLRFVVDETLDGRGDQLNQAAIATAVFGRGRDFDAVLDPIVRVQAGRLRRALERYYRLPGQMHPVSIELPKGSYTPVFRIKEAGAPAEAAVEFAAPGYADSSGFWREVMLASALGHLGRLNEARASLEESLKVKPDFRTRGAMLIDHCIEPPELRTMIVEGLAKAGLTLPE